MKIKRLLLSNVRLWPIADIGRQLICRVMYISSHFSGEPFESLLSI